MRVGETFDILSMGGAQGQVVRSPLGDLYCCFAKKKKKAACQEFYFAKRNFFLVIELVPSPA